MGLFGNEIVSRSECTVHGNKILIIVVRREQHVQNVKIRNKKYVIKK